MRRAPSKVALLDWDNSLHPGFTLGPWLHRLARDASEAEAGLRFDAARAEYEDGTRTYDAFAGEAEELYIRLAGGRFVEELGSLAADLVREDPLRPGATDLIAALHETGVRPVLVSGAPIEVLRAHALALGIDPLDVTGWELARDGSLVLGRLLKNTARGGAKATIVARHVAAGDSIVLGLGDAPADQPLIDAARIGARVDARAEDETTRVRWTDRIAGTTLIGSLSHLAKVVRDTPRADPTPS